MTGTALPARGHRSRSRATDVRRRENAWDGGRGVGRRPRVRPDIPPTRSAAAGWAQRLSSFIAAPRPSSVIGCMRPPKISWIIWIEWVYFHYRSGTGLIQVQDGHLSMARFSQTSPASSFQCSDAPPG